ncbi:hypothetical protein RAM_29525 [Amycolatopsis mediterranei S699]|uniref:Uncharacterized protein n=1 Tax=Amycolatopsis mediterranei (strain S699) TaxID=713604 RepID=A0A9R0P199_AMYMS|nr:hypothetical protein RAM_29525 [Amycolatopsis mediterranei S699]
MTGLTPVRSVRAASFGTNPRASTACWIRALVGSESFPGLWK